MKKKKLLTIMLSLAMAFSLVPNVGAKAADDTATATDATVDLGSEEQSVGAAAKEVGKVEATVTAPVPGAKPDATFTYTEPGVDIISQGTSPKLEQALGWTYYDYDKNVFVPVTTFEGGGEYKFRFLLRAHDGYQLTDEFFVLVNGNNAYRVYGEDDGYGLYEITFHTAEDYAKATVIDLVKATVTLPDVGTLLKKTEGYGVEPQPTVSSSSDKYEALEAWISDGEIGEDGCPQAAYEGKIQNESYYYVEVWFGARSGYKFSTDTKFSINDGLPYEVIESYFDPEHPSIISILVKMRTGGKETYKILDGDNQTITAGGTLKVRASGDLKDCKGVKIDGQWVDLQFLEFKNGSTIVTVAAEYLSKLSAGEHTLTFVYYFGEVSTKFTIKASTNDSVKTGDTAPIAMFAGLMMFALCGMVALKKKEQ